MQFPEDKELVELKAEGYVGIPLRDRKGGAIGVLCAISRQKLNLPKKTEQIMRILATKASSEIERKEAEETAMESEKRFHTSVENMLDCFGIYQAIRDESGRIVDFRIEYVNAATCANNLMTKDEQIGKRLCKLLPAHRETGLFDEYCQVVETGRPLRKESIIYEDVYGSKQLKRVFGISAVKLGDGFAVAWRDITERKQAEQSLQEAEAELKHTIEVVPCIIAKANARTGYFTHCNPALSSILGFSSEEFLARPFIEFVHPDDRQSTINEVEKQLKGSPVARSLSE
jgi:PAS domain-containing protein